MRRHGSYEPRSALPDYGQSEGGNPRLRKPFEALALSSFAHVNGVEPTNNHTDPGLRGAVIYRKLSLGTQSDTGERSVERQLSASITCRLRKQSLYAYLTEVITAHARGDPIPALS